MKVKAQRVESESAILASILKYCGQAGIFAQRRNVAGAQRLTGGHYVRLGKKGQSDIWGILKGGRHFECECKKPGEQPTPEQVKWLTQCACEGGYSFWVTSLDEFISVIDRATKGVRK